VIPSRPAERLYALACGAMFVFGIVLSLPGTVLGLPEVAAALELSLADRGALISTLFVGLLAGSLASGPIVDALGQRAGLLLSTALTGVCLPLLGSAGHFSTAAAALAALGVAAAGVNIAANALSSDLFPAERGRRMNGIALMVGLGGLAMPAVTALAGSSISWRVVLTAGGGLALVLAGAGLFVRAAGAAVTTAADSPVEAIAGFVGQRHFLWFGVLLALGGGNEASIAGWTSTYLGAAGFDASAATLVLASHWLGLVIGRVVFLRRVDRNKTGAVIRGSLSVAGGVVLLVTAHAVPLLAITPFLLGLALSVVVPTMLAIAGERFAGNAGTLFGALLTMAQIGGIVAPALIGATADALGVRSGLLVVAASALLVAGLTHLVR
jgi:DHA1 family bicyclomycin/chloramphenicol resistance-like MFS transporter